ncbi:MAG: hypothetical protein ACJ76R_00450, partial [Solirubrobacteraceae bacterium]
SKQEIAELSALSNNAPSAGRNLRQFLQAFDDRNRASQPDPRAEASAPPAPDPAAYHKGQGFTGFEALLNYPYWQTLALNSYDSIGHLLRIVLNINGCSAWQTGPVITKKDDPENSNEDLFKACNSWLGPYQPGVTAPDPTRGKYDNSRKPVEADKPGAKSKKGAAPAAGQPEATKPLPGQTDPSKPRVVLPPAIQKLLEQLPKLPVGAPDLNNLPNVQAGDLGGGQVDDQSADKLLDFLLAP